MGGTGPASELPRPIAADAQLQSAAVVTYMLNQNNCDSAAGYLLAGPDSITDSDSDWPDSDSQACWLAGLLPGLGLPGPPAGRTRTRTRTPGPAGRSDSDWTRKNRTGLVKTELGQRTLNGLGLGYSPWAGGALSWIVHRSIRTRQRGREW